MSSFLQEGNYWYWTNESAATIKSDTVVVIGRSVALTAMTVLPGQTGSVRVVGVVDWAKPVGEQWFINEPLNWDRANNRFTKEYTDLLHVAVVAEAADADAERGSAFIMPKLVTDENYQLQGYGGLLKDTATNYGTLADGSYITVNNWDGGMVGISKGVVEDVTNSGLIVNRPGLYKFEGSTNLSFDEANNTRTLAVRLYNATDDAPGRSTNYSVPRNQLGINVVGSGSIITIGAAQIGALFQIQIGSLGGSPQADFANFTVQNSLISLSRIG